MTCDEADILIHALLDGELDTSHAREVEGHMAECPNCTASLATYRQMRREMAAAQLHLQAPAALRRRIEATLVIAPRSDRRAVLKGL